MPNTKPVGVAYSDPELVAGTTITGATITGATITGGTATGMTISGATITGGTATGMTSTSATLVSPTLTGASVSVDVAKPAAGQFIDNRNRLGLNFKLRRRFSRVERLPSKIHVELCFQIGASDLGAVDGMSKIDDCHE